MNRLFFAFERDAIEFRCFFAAFRMKTAEKMQKSPKKRKQTATLRTAIRAL